jgi:ABC-type dipeptide/oligopeptide/nickel transport system ATPase component
MMRLQAEMGLAFLFISHDIAVVDRISHRIAVMYLGEIVEIGPRASIIENPQHPYARKLMAAAPTAEPARVRLGVSNEETPSPSALSITGTRRGGSGKWRRDMWCRRSVEIPLSRSSRERVGVRAAPITTPLIRRLRRHLLPQEREKGAVHPSRNHTSISPGSRLSQAK